MKKEDCKRWTVTYTKHIKQKRKVYQEGFLELNTASSKMALYDECEKLLECRLLKKDESVTSGETLVFNGYLVDIGGPEGNNRPEAVPNIDVKYKKSLRFRSPADPAKHTKVNAKENAPSTQKPLSPSQKIIKEFRKKSQRELLKYGSGSPKLSQDQDQETPKPSTAEWEVLYTTQVTQKAKKYHDGFLRLVICGSRGAQVMLFDATRKLLHSRFLKKDDVIKSGESLAFDAYLIDIGDRQESHTPDSNVQGGNCTTTERMKKVDRQRTSLDTDTHLTIGKREWQVLYTTQLTQKAKKYHDGFLQLEIFGSLGRQVVLCDLSKRTLERRFLKKDEVIRSGESVCFDGHLVEVGEPEGTCHSPVKLNERGADTNIVDRRKLRREQNGSLKVNPSVAKGKPPRKPFLEQDAGLNSFFADIAEIKSNKIVTPIKTLRDANQILSILQDPKPQESYVKGDQPPNWSCQNIMGEESTGTTKSLDTSSSKGKSRSACGGGSIHFTENTKMSNESNSDRETHTNMGEEDVALFVSSSGGNSSTNEGKSAGEFSCETETFPSFDLGF